MMVTPQSLSPSPLPLSAPTKKRSMACDFCRLRKIGCDKGFPCVKCIQAETPCTYGVLGSAKARPNHKKYLEYGNRNQFLNTKLEESINTAHSQQVTRLPYMPRPCRSMPQIQFQNEFLPSSFKYVLTKDTALKSSLADNPNLVVAAFLPYPSVSSTVYIMMNEQEGGQLPKYNELHLQPITIRNRRDPSKVKAKTLDQLYKHGGFNTILGESVQQSQLVRQLVGLFFYHVSPLYPMLTQQYIYNMLESSQLDMDQALLINVLCLRGVDFYTFSTLISPLRQYFYYTVEQYIKLLQFRPSLATLQALLITSIYRPPLTEERVPVFNTLNLYHQSVSMAWAMGIHQKNPKLSKITNELRNRALSCLFISDQQYSHTLGFPSLFKLENVAHFSLPEYIPELDDGLPFSNYVRSEFPNPIEQVSFFRSLVEFKLMVTRFPSLTTHYSHLSPNMSKTALFDATITEEHRNNPEYHRFWDETQYAEMDLHMWYYNAVQSFRPQASFNETLVCVPDHRNYLECALLIRYLSMIILLNRPHLNQSMNFRPEFIQPHFETISLEAFIALPPSDKVNLAACLGTQALLKHRQAFILKSLHYYWGCLFNFMLIHLRNIKLLKNQPLIELVKMNFDHLLNFVAEGSQKWLIAAGLNQYIQQLALSI